MALSIDTYNKLFKSFTDFAQERVNANDAKAIADAKIEAPLGGRKMLAVNKAVNDSVHNWTRGFAFVTVSVLKDLNSKGWKQPEHNIGMATISQRTTIDLTKEMPEVIDITFSQTFTPDQIILPAAQ